MSNETTASGVEREPIYVLVPGWVRSASDGDRHYVGARQLAALYRVPLRRCLVKADRPRQFPEGAVFLHPRPDGNYRPPGEGGS